MSSRELIDLSKIMQNKRKGIGLLEIIEIYESSFWYVISSNIENFLIFSMYLYKCLFLGNSVHFYGLIYVSWTLSNLYHVTIIIPVVYIIDFLMFSSLLLFQNNFKQIFCNTKIVIIMDFWLMFNSMCLYVMLYV